MSDFDLASAQPVQFDLDSAKPVGSASLPSSPTPSLSDQILRKIALGGRSAAEGVMSTFMLPLDAAVVGGNLINHGIDRVFGTHLGDYPTFASRFSQALTQAGAPTAQTPGEQMGSAIARGVTGALTGGGLLGGASTVPNAVRVGVSGATGAASSEGLRQAGVGPLGQFVGGLVGGMVPSAVEGVTRVGINAARPLFKSGQQQIAADTLAGHAQDPQAAAANLNASAPIVPNSLPTSGAASQDTGILALEKGLRGRNPVPFADRLSEQNAARQAELGSLGGTPTTVTAEEAARDAQTSAMREAAFAKAQPADVGPVVDKIDTILKSPVGKRDIASQALTWLKGKLFDADGNPETDPANLYAVRQDVNDAIAGKLGGDQSKFKLAQGQLIQVRKELDTAIDTAAPGFKDYLAKYGELSKPINQKTLIQQLQERASQTAFDPKTGQYFISPAQYSNALDSSLAEKLNPLTAEQTQRLENLRADLQNSQAVNGPLLKAPGSDTFQNLSLNQVLGGGGSIGRVALKPLNWLYKAGGTDEKVNEILTQAMLDPKLAASLLLKGNPQTVQALLQRVRGGIVPYAQGGLLGSLAAQPAGTGSQQ